MAEVIHKLNITPEAAYDLGECLNLQGFDKRALKAETDHAHDCIRQTALVGLFPLRLY